MAGGKHDEQAHPSNEYDRPSNRCDPVQKEETGHINIEILPREEQELQQLSPNGNAQGQEETPEPRSCFKKQKTKIAFGIGIVIGIGIGIGITFLAFHFSSTTENQKTQAVQTVYWVNKPTLNPDDCKLLLAGSEHERRPCLTDWFGYKMKCFYFSDKEETWSASQDFCSLYNASLAIIEKEEMDFLHRYKGSTSHWIGLQRDPKQSWKWVNGNASTWEVLGDGGNCAFLNDEGRASCSRCRNLHHWICSKPDEFASPKIV